MAQDRLELETMHREVERLRQLPIAERLLIVEELWDDLAASDEPFPLPPWQREEVQRRAADLETDSTIAIDREELWQRVDHING